MIVCLWHCYYRQTLISVFILFFFYFIIPALCFALVFRLDGKINRKVSSRRTLVFSAYRNRTLRLCPCSPYTRVHSANLCALGLFPTQDVDCCAGLLPTAAPIGSDNYYNQSRKKRDGRLHVKAHQIKHQCTTELHCCSSVAARQQRYVPSFIYIYLPPFPFYISYTIYWREKERHQTKANVYFVLSFCCCCCCVPFLYRIEKGRKRTSNREKENSHTRTRYSLFMLQLAIN